MTIYDFPTSINLLGQPLPAPAAEIDLENYFNNNVVEDSRYIDPITGDYALQSNGMFYGMPSVEQRVYRCLFTTFNSSSVPGFGDDLGSLQLLTPNIDNQVANLVNSCLSDVVNDGSISIRSINVQPISANNSNVAPGQLSISVSYVDNQAAQVKQSNITFGK